MVKESTRNSLERYQNEHVPTGGFLRAVLANDLMQAMGRADIENRRDIFEIVGYIYNDMPGSCHGSYAIVGKWLVRNEE